MKMLLRTLLLAFVGALIGVVAGHALLERQHPPSNEIHAFTRDQLNLDAEQKQKLMEIERRFASRRGAIEAELRAHNTLLADAIVAEKSASPRVYDALARSHEAMRQLQKETLVQVFAMRQLLRPDQAQKFDQAVARALSEDHREPSTGSAPRQ